MDKLVAELLDKETLTGEEILKILGIKGKDLGSTTASNHF
ncbi:hypothetical protein PPL_05614 [Heterostelium album PN500]|uniref:Uncharacterized protein n=1 Tax=Heterostelium pallidum (strain ATCC 26659 / Pp 5 / PN500) TaxID=670386 RepID=D3BAN6_HETP5|nr:hypothetical protein PPL_05614 [Heterostelium album PN500]EFA81623.1 hypothetical protein PPL_05614 [Heterostelium album PN500]|eukprot:XP_020433740.1 hypothetical protein PPL_05614 [Heterostelium album PN500]